MKKKYRITHKTVGTSLGVYYLFYVNGKFVESCDENELEEVQRELELKFAS